MEVEMEPRSRFRGELPSKAVLWVLFIVKVSFCASSLVASLLASPYLPIGDGPRLLPIEITNGSVRDNRYLDTKSKLFAASRTEVDNETFKATR